MAKNDPSQTIDKYERELKATGAYHQKNFWKRAERMVKLYELNHYGAEDSTQSDAFPYDRIKVPYPYANSRQILAEIYIKTPEVIVNPTKEVMETTSPATGQPIVVDMVKGAKTLKSVIDYCIQESNLKKEAKLAVLDGIVTGMGCLMISAQKNTKVPRYKRIVYRDILFPIDVDYPNQAAWVTRRIIRSLDDVKGDERYAKAARENVRANYKLDEAYTSEMNDYFKQFSYVVLWDRWDRQNDKHCVWADGSRDFLVEEKISDVYKFKVETDEFPVDFPFSFFINEEMISKPFGLGDVAPIESQVRELDKTRTQQMNHRKRFNRKYLYKDNFLDERGLEQLKSSDDGTLVKVKSDIIPSNFSPVVDAPLSADVYKSAIDMIEDIQRISPLGPDALRSGVGQQPGTLGEAQIIEQNADTRLGEKRDVVSEFFARIFRLTAQYVQQYWIEEDVIRISGNGDKPTDWLEYNPDEVQGSYNFDVDPETLRDNSAVFRKQASEALQIAAPILAQLGYIPGIAILLKKYLDTFNWKDTDKIVPEQLTQPPPPLPEDPMAAGMPGGADAADPYAALLDLINNNDPQAVLDSLQGLPDNQRVAITEAIQGLKGGQGAPSAPNIAGAISNVRS